MDNEIIHTNRQSSVQDTSRRGINTCCICHIRLNDDIQIIPCGHGNQMRPRCLRDWAERNRICPTNLPGRPMIFPSCVNYSFQCSSIMITQLWYDAGLFAIPCIDKFISPFPFKYSIIMPRKKNREDKQQPRIMEWVGGQQPPLTAEGRKEQMEKEIVKLLKIRRQIESKQQEEERIIKRIVRLQIGEDKQQPSVQQVDEQEQEYLILTLHQTLANVHSPNMIKLCLGDYGEIFVSQKKTVDLPQTEQQMAVEEERHIQVRVKEWKENASLCPDLLTDYSNNFLQYLQQMQYNADSLQASLASK